MNEKGSAQDAADEQPAREKKTGHRYTKENRADVPGRGKGRRSILLEAFEGMKYKAQDGTVKDLTPVEFMRIGIAKGVSGDPALIREIISRIEPAVKGEFARYIVQLDRTASPHEQMQTVIDAFSAGLIPQEYANTLNGMIKDRVAVMEASEIMHELEALRARMDAADAAKKAQFAPPPETMPDTEEGEE
ncbi:hypothetical protein KYT24_004380 [Salmonella enterica]|nr:hypothetical protein [Salmonella enterica]